MKRVRVHVIPEEGLQASVNDLTGQGSRRRPWLWLALLCWFLAGVIYRCNENSARAELPTVEWERRAAPPPAPLVNGANLMCVAPAPVVAPPPTPFGLLILDPATEQERRQVETAITGCAWADPRIADPFVALALLRLEQEADAPFGLLLSVWCRESSMRTQTRLGKRIRGDWHDGAPDSFGPFQLQRPFIAACGGDTDRADDPVWAANCYLSRVLLRLPGVDCPDTWRVAEARVANAPKYLPRGCRAESEHWKIRKEWRWPD